MPEDRHSCELLRAVVRRPVDAGQISLLAGEVENWDSLLGLANEHRVAPLLLLRLEETGTAVPESVRAWLRAEYHRNVLHSMANAAELLGVLEAFDREKIPAMPFKGVVLAASAYGDLKARSAGDLDLLIHFRDLARATEMILARGYKRTTETRADGAPVLPDYYECVFERATDGMVLELRWRLELTQPRFRRDIGMDWVWPRRRTAMLAGAVVPDMSAETTLLVLCMHGSKHVWSRLLWICDVARLLDSSPDLDWNEVIGEARKTGLWRALALGVLLAHRVAGVGVPEDVMRVFEGDKTSRRLALHIADNLFDSPGSRPEGRVPYNVQLLGFRDRVRFFVSLDLLRPSARDVEALPLPKWLHPLYYLIRPFRVLWDRSAR